VSRHLPSTAGRKTTKADKPSLPTSGRTLHLLVADEDQATRTAVEHCPAVHGTVIHAASNLAQARAILTSEPIDLVLVAAAFAHDTGLKLAQDVLTHKAGVQVMLLTDKPSLPLAVDAMRLGVTDLLAKPIASAEVDQRLRQAITRARAERRVQNRVRNLRKLCRSLDDARREISSQVEVLCNDLVAAYQELANQMQQAIQSSEFNAVVRSELDLEQFVRKLLEYLLDKAGPTNAAVFLPANMDEFTLGGYINYDCTNDSPDFLLQHLGDTLAPRLAEHDGLVSVTDPQAMRQLLGEGCTALDDAHLQAITCKHEGEVLAVIVLFRHHAQPFEDAVAEALPAIGPIIAQSLARIIRVHHRHRPEPPQSNDSDETPGLEAA